MSFFKKIYAEGENMKKTKRILLALLCVCLVFTSLAAMPVSAARQKVIPGGMNFGVKFFTDGVLVVGTTTVATERGQETPARDAGIKIKESIIAVNGNKVNSIEEFAQTVNSTQGKETVLTVKNEAGEAREVKITPVLNSETGRFCLGVWVRDSTAGIGTVTYINADTGAFGGLGHGISDIDTGAIMNVGKAYVVDVNITSINKGQGSTPGELKGTFGKKVRGEIYKNAPTGVFGVFTTLPETTAQPVEVARRKEVKEGDATVLCQIDGKVGEYAIKILKIYDDSGKTKNFLIKVTDQKLLEASGGIVQGMSGSPILQNGRLVGAVTHV